MIFVFLCRNICYTYLEIWAQPTLRHLSPYGIKIKMRDYILLLRPQQWVKNLFVFAPMFFSNNLFEHNYLLWGCVIFVSFCFLSSSVYCFNDILDKDYDSQHPTKKNRPICSNRVSVKEGYSLMILTLIISMILLLAVNIPNVEYLFFTLLCYYAFNIIYCLKLKQIAILDIVVISIGYVLRVFAGGVIGIWISEWIIIMTFLLSLYLALFKRRSDYYSFQQTGIMSRKSLNGYNLPFIDFSLLIVLSVTLVSYIMYSVSDAVVNRMGSPYLYLTTLWVIVGMFRVIQKMQVFKFSESPTSLLYQDRMIQLSIFGWILSFFVIIYL